MTDVELIKSKIDIVSYIAECVPLKKAGRHFKANCPFHSEKSPSFIVSPERQSWHCFGACSTGGDVISFVQKYENLEFVEALKLLAQRSGVTLSHQGATSEQSKQKERIYEMNHLAAEFYHYILIKHQLGERARSYVHERGIKEKIVETFFLGYAPNSWNSLLNYLSKKGYGSDEMETAGLIVKGQHGRGYDRFRGRLMFTLRDHRGNVAGFSGRVLPPAPDKEAKYINTSETPVYIKGNMLYGLDVTREAIKKEGYAIIVEGEFDLLASYQSGVSNIVAIKGTALTEDHISLLGRYTKEVRLALDSDIAGNEASRRGIEKAEAADMTVRVVELPKGKDPADCIASEPHLWKQAVERAVPVYDFIIDAAAKRYDPHDVVGKKRISDLVVPVLHRISNTIVQSHYVRKLASLLSISEESVEMALRKQKVPKQIAETIRQPAAQSVSREQRTEEYVLSLILQSKDPMRSYKQVRQTIMPQDFSQPPLVALYGALGTYLDDHTAFDLQQFAGTLPKEIVPAFDRVYLADASGVVDDAVKFGKELELMCREMKKLVLRRKQHQLTTDIKRHATDESRVEELTKELQAVLSDLQQIEKDSGNKVQ